jgi:hypothetical protein
VPGRLGAARGFPPNGRPGCGFAVLPVPAPPLLLVVVAVLLLPLYAGTRIYCRQPSDLLVPAKTIRGFGASEGSNSSCPQKKTSEHFVSALRVATFVHASLLSTISTTLEHSPRHTCHTSLLSTIYPALTCCHGPHASLRKP